MTQQWIKMTKGGEEKLVHPGNVENHERFGWVRTTLATPPSEAVAPVEAPTEESPSSAFGRHVSQQASQR